MGHTLACKALPTRAYARARPQLHMQERVQVLVLTCDYAGAGTAVT
jgi:hypothetical protein